MTAKKVIAVVFGGRSVEHDVSILSGLQFLEALDPGRFEGLPVYIDPLGQWWTGDALRSRARYPVEESPNKDLIQLSLDLAAPATEPRFLARKKTLLGEKEEVIPFDLIVPAIHGTNGEDGTLQGLLDFAGVPYAGCRALGAAATMDKIFAKHVARESGVKTLGELKVIRPSKGTFLNPDSLQADLEAQFGELAFPYIVKPCNLGSSVGVSKAEDIDGLVAALMQAFRHDSIALVEPFVANLVEYNIAVRRSADGTVVTSAIERPLRDADLLDFKNKYLAGGSPGGPKLDQGPSEGMASTNRILNPDELSKDQATFIRETAANVFDAFDLAGSVRIDFLADGESGEIWFNEANTIPGSFAYFLWEAADEPLSFLSLTSAMIDEGFRLSTNRLGNTGVEQGGSAIFARR